MAKAKTPFNVDTKIQPGDILSQSDVLKAVAKEEEYALLRFGVMTDNKLQHVKHSTGDYLTLLCGLVAKAHEEYMESTTDAPVLDYIRKVAQVSIVAMKQLGTGRKRGDGHVHNRRDGKSRPMSTSLFE